MELREFAETLLFAEDLEAKLSPAPSDLTDDRPGAAERAAWPGRPANLALGPKSRGVKMPKLPALSDARLRAIAHHVMANHELQALEVMAWTLLAFPDAPPEFRTGLARVMRDEQRHTRLHIRRAEALGLGFGDVPVNGYVWKKVLASRDLLDYLACLPLTFEGANLDHTLDFAARFDEVNDPAGAAVLRAIHHDEIDHVSFGLNWFRKLKPASMTDWDAYLSHLRWPLAAVDASGRVFRREPRIHAGLDEAFIDCLEVAHDEGQAANDKAS